MFLCIHDQDADPLFCYVPNIPVSRTNFAAIQKNVYIFAKMDMDKITTHSLWIGIASHCTDIAMIDSSIRLLDRWKSDAFKIYNRPINTSY